MPPFAIKPLLDPPPIRASLSELLVETVASGGSVSFMHPMPLRDADVFWTDSLAAAAPGERIVVGGFADEGLIRTGTLVLTPPPPHPQRAEIAKMMTRLSHRHRGVATALMRVAEAAAIARGRTLLVLD